MAFDEGGIGKGSGRSISDFDLVQGLSDCSGFLIKFGGHRLAAGMSLCEEKFDAFRDAFNEVCRKQLSGLDLTERLTIDAWLDLGKADHGLMELQDRLTPFGEGNPAPVWACRGVRLAGPPRILKDAHLKMIVVSGTAQAEAIAWGMGKRTVPDGPIDIAFTLEKNNYGGRESIVLNVRDFRPSRSDS